MGVHIVSFYIRGTCFALQGCGAGKVVLAIQDVRGRNGPPCCFIFAGGFSSGQGAENGSMERASAVPLVHSVTGTRRFPGYHAS
jgi:hypothetical protein